MLSIATWPARAKIAGMRFEQAELRAAVETLRLAAETRRAYFHAVARARCSRALSEVKASAEASADARRDSSRRPARSTSSSRREGRCSPPRSRRK